MAPGRRLLAGLGLALGASLAPASCAPPAGETPEAAGSGPDPPQVAPEPSWEAALGRLQAAAALPSPPESWGTEAQRQLLRQVEARQGLVRLQPGNDELLFEIAQLYSRALFPASALQVLGLMLADDPDHAGALYLAAECLQADRRPEDAVALLHRVLELAPQHPTAHALLAAVLDRLGRPAEAAEAARAGLELQPFHGGLKLLLGRLAWESGSLAEADELLGEAVSNAPDSMEARYARARFLEERGRLEEAAVEAAAHARLSRLDDLGLPAGLGRDERSLALARAYLEDGEPDRAEEELRALLARGADPAGFRLLQELLEAQERDAGAELRALAEAHPHLRGLEARR